MYEGLGLYIDGAWRQGSGGRMQTVLDPATERSIGSVPVAEGADVEAAIAAAEKARHGWAKLNAWDRAATIRRIGDLIRARADAFSHMVAVELGRPIKHVAGEIALAADQFEWFAEETKRLYGQTVESRQPNGRIVISQEPVGVVAAFTAWNFPLVLLARKIAPALAAGCSIVCRPSEETPGSAMLLIKCCHDAGTPPGLVNLVLGKASAIAAVVMQSRAVRKISLTGSIDVGKQLFRQSADTLKRMSMELGGHAPVIVCADSDAIKAAEITVPVKFRNAGQVCVSPSRFFIHESKLDDFTSRFVEIRKSSRSDRHSTPIAMSARLERQSASERWKISWPRHARRGRSSNAAVNGRMASTLVIISSRPYFQHAATTCGSCVKSRLDRWCRSAASRVSRR